MDGTPPSYDPRYGSGPALPPELDPRGARRHSRADGGAVALGSFKVIARVLCVALSAALVVYIGYLWMTVRGINDVPRVVIQSLDGASTNSKTGQTVHRTDIDGKDQNLLIVGNDDRSTMTPAEVRELKVGFDGGSLNTDSMMIIHIPADGSQATLISLPRDSYVHIPGYGMYKLNSAYAFGYNHAHSNKLADKIAAGADLLTRVVQGLTGLNIDHFVQVTLLGFVQISDAVGGVTVNLCHSVNDTVAHNRSIGLSGGSGLVLSKGKHTIQGVQALEFVRQREGLPHGDIDRTARQRYFLTAAFRKVASAGSLLDPGKLSKLISAVKKSIYVDQGLNMLDLAKQLSNLSANNIVGESIPFERFADTDVGSVEIVDPHRVQQFVENLIGGGTESAAYKSAKTLDPSSMSVSVINAGSQNGAATAATKVLDRAGFQADVDSSEPPQQATTTITYAKGQEGQAKTLAKYVPGAEVKRGSVSTVTLTLGTDGLTAHKAPVKTTPSHHKRHKAIDSGCIN